MDASSIPEKRCTCCNQFYPATTEHFAARADRPGKLRTICRYCKRPAHTAAQRERRADPVLREHEQRLARLRYSNNIEEYRRRKREHAKTPSERERRRIYARSYTKTPKARAKRASPHQKAYESALYKRWRLNNPESARIKHHRRRARKHLVGGSYSVTDIETQLRSQRGRCWHCGKSLDAGYHIDHLIPLSRGGSNAADNIVLACPPCNLSKGAKLPQEWNGKLF